MASRRTISTARSRSVRGVFRNLSRAGVAKNRSRTSTRVPGGWAAGAGARLSPASTVISQAFAASAGRETMRIRLTAPIDGNASPRKPSAAICERSSSGNFEVQWRSTARLSSSRVMPAPLSATEINAWPPSLRTTSMREAPASIAFSTSSLTAAAGRSTTSPAAMRLTRTGGSRRIAIGQLYFFPAAVTRPRGIRRLTAGLLHYGVRIASEALEQVNGLDGRRSRHRVGVAGGRIGTRARRCGGRDRIHQSLQVVDTAYHAAGSTAIFEENPFERRFRDIHTVSQHLQGRSEHFETVGQYLIGLALDSLMWL